MTEDEMVGWHHGLNAHEFVQVLGDGEGQGSLVCCSPWGLQELVRTERLNTINIPGFVGHSASLTPAQLCHCDRKGATDNIQTNGRAVF